MSIGFELDGVGMSYNGSVVLDGVSLRFDRPELVAIAGPNGAGKSTMLNVMAGLRPSHTGHCLYRGREIRKWNRRHFARSVSMVPQGLTLMFPFTVEQVVLQGRTPYGDGLFESPRDFEAVEQAMEITESAGFRQRDFRSLSGGERQRVIIASAIAQEPESLLLDEPTTFLDIRHQVSIYRLLADLSRRGILVITITHDLNLAAAFADRLIVIESGRIRADATPGEVLSEQMVREVFGVSSQVYRTAGGRPWIVYGDSASDR
ncbi:MAG: ABC transporter ATP-binding protein [Bryobacterales bacterium]|nr:ABC transporter ATP-binding protein [Bryobacterales bacterium]